MNRCFVLAKTLVLLSAALWACSGPELTTTEQDAMAFDFTPVRCEGLRGVRVYVPAGRVQTTDQDCGEARLALAQARASTVVPSTAVADDSIAAAVVARVEYAMVGAEDSVVPGVHVTLDLRHRSFNLLVVTAPSDQRVVGTAPKGLRY